MSRRSMAARDRRVRLRIWLLTVAVGAFVYFCHHPLHIKQEAKISQGVAITLDSASDYLIVVDESMLNPAPENFMSMSFSYAWINTFQQEIGPVSVINAQQFPDADLSKHKLIVLTRSVSERGDWTPKIRSYLERGGHVLMEMPGAKLRTLASADGKGGVRKPQTLTYAEGLLPEYQKALSSIKLSEMTQIIGSAGPLDASRTLLTIDGVPVIYSKDYAAGSVITVDFDYGMLLTSLQQGRPLDDFTIRNMRGTPQIETEDLAKTDNPEMPSADILERFLVYGVIGKHVPAVGFWPFFDGMSGAVIVTHDEAGMGDAALWMPQYESTFQASSTLFARSPLRITPYGAGLADKYHTEIGLSFDLNSGEGSTAQEPMGSLKFSPIWRAHTLDQQAQNLRRQMPDGAQPVSSQSKDGIWTEDYTRGFRMIAAAGFRNDASYRAPETSPGYVFGTGFPFIPLDINGGIFNVLSYPVVFSSLETESQRRFFESVIENSAKQLHEVVTVSFKPGRYPSHPDYEIFETWRETYRIATERKHWITGISNYFRFSRARFTGELKSRLGEAKMGNKTVLALRLELLAPEPGMSVSVPATLRSRTFREARRGLQRVKEDALLPETIQTDAVSLMGYDRITIPISRGFNAIDVLYE